MPSFSKKKKTKKQHTLFPSPSFHAKKKKKKAGIE